MAKTKVNSEPTAAVESPAVEPVQSVYTVEELAQGAFMIGSTPDVVTAAFRVAGKTEATLAEAVDIVHDFARKEVK